MLKQAEWLWKRKQHQPRNTETIFNVFEREKNKSYLHKVAPSPESR